MGKRQIWKYPLSQSQEQTVRMPKDAVILCVHEQHGVPALWAMVDLDAPTENRTFVIVGTGWDTTQDPADCIGTVFVQGGRFVWHIFEPKP